MLWCKFGFGLEFFKIVCILFSIMQESLVSVILNKGKWQGKQADMLNF